MDYFILTKAGNEYQIARSVYEAALNCTEIEQGGVRFHRVGTDNEFYVAWDNIAELQCFPSIPL